MLRRLHNQFGYNIDKISATGLYVAVTSGSTYWVNLFNASVHSGDPVYWDENGGAGCHSQGCPSQASESALGTIPSEAFDIAGPGGGVCGSGGLESKPELNFQVIYYFSGEADGAHPNAAGMDAHGNIYGTTSGFCYECNSYTAFKLSPHGSAWVLDPLYQFPADSVFARSVGPEGRFTAWRPATAVVACSI